MKNKPEYWHSSGGLEYESAWALGAFCDNRDVASIAKLIDQCNDLGLDPIELGNALSMYMEATERGWALKDGDVPRLYVRTNPVHPPPARWKMTENCTSAR